MLGAICGDIIGSRFEGHDDPGRHFMLFTSESRFTDDTVLTLAVADWLLAAQDPRDALPDDLAATLRIYHAQYPVGYGPMFHQWCEQTLPPDAEPSEGNGAVMRIGAIPYVTTNPFLASQLAYCQAILTHSIEAARYASLIANAVIEAKTSRRSAERVFCRPDRTDVDYCMEVLVFGKTLPFDACVKPTVHRAMAAFLVSENFEQAIRLAVSFGGDTDTIACIAGMLAQARYGVPRAIGEQALTYLTPELHGVYDAFVLRYPEAGKMK